MLILLRILASTYTFCIHPLQQYQNNKGHLRIENTVFVTVGGLHLSHASPFVYAGQQTEAVSHNFAKLCAMRA